MKTKGLMLILLLCSVAWADIPTSPEPNVPVDYDPNLCQSPVFDYKQTDVETSFIYEFRAYSLSGATILPEDVNITEAGYPIYGYTVAVDDPNEAVMKVGDVNLPVFIHPIRFLWTPSEVRLHYLNITVTNVTGTTGSGTLLLDVKYKDDIELYPADYIIVTTAREAGEIWQRAFANAVKANEREPVYLPGEDSTLPIYYRLKNRPTYPTRRL